MGQQLFEEPFREFLLDLRERRGFLPSGFGHDSFALLFRPLLLLGPLFDLLLPAEVSDQSQRDDAHGSYGDEPAS